MYSHTASELWSELQNRFPRTCGSIKEPINELDNCQKLKFELIYGDVQSGKSRAILLLSWYSCFINQCIIPVVLTINLSVVRDDFSAKASEYGEINQIVSDYLYTKYKDHPNYTEIKNYFKLSTITYHDIKDSEPDIKPGQILVLLQEQHNIVQLVKYWHNINKSKKYKLVVLIDELHKMYTSHQKFGVNNISLLNWLVDQCHHDQLYLLGITATPGRSIVNTENYPNKIYKLESDPICGTVYYGIDKIHVSDLIDLNLVSTIDHILKQKHQTIGNQHVIKQILITIDKSKAGHYRIRDQLESSFDNQLLIYVINNDTDKLHECYLDIYNNLKNPNICQKLVNGAIVIIGQTCLSAGVSVKPPPGISIELTQNRKQYKLFGITDQVYDPFATSKPKSMENNIQAMRLLGCYPIGYKLTLWTKSAVDYELLSEQFRINHLLVNSYDTSPISIKYYTSHMGFKLFVDDPYVYNSVDKHQHAVYTNNTQQFDHMFKTIILPVGKWLQLDSFFKSSESIANNINSHTTLHELHNDFKSQHILKNAIVDSIKNHFDSFSSIENQINTHFDAPYSDERYNSIITASAHPHSNDDNLVNCYLTGDLQHYTNVEDLNLVVFTESAESRKKITKPSDTVCFQENTNKFVYVYGRNSSLFVFEHSNINFIDVVISTPINKSDDFEKLIDDYSSQKYHNGWSVYYMWYRTHIGPSQISVIANSWSKLDKQDKTIFIDGIRNNEPIANIIQTYNSQLCVCDDIVVD